MSAVHVVVNKPMLESEYAVFFTLLRVFLLMSIPAAGLQVVFAEQSAAASSPTEEQKLSATIRAVLRATFYLWLIMATIVFLCRRDILATLKISNPAALWATLLLGLVSLWAPVVKGILQGRQNFAGLGWVMILDGLGRFSAIVLIVHWGGQAAGGMTGALIGQMISLALGVWLVWSLLTGPGAGFDWRPWLTKVAPLSLGVGVILFMYSSDVVYVQTMFSKDESPFYTPAAMIGLALVTFTTPLAAVMFPKVVQSAARSEKSDALRHALTATALLGVIAAVACTLLPELPLRIIYFRNAIYWKSAPLVPWIAWALLPLIVANVLINNLLARARFRIVPWILFVAAIYGGALFTLKDRLLFFSGADIKDSAVLSRRLQDPGDPLSVILSNQPGNQNLGTPSTERERSTELVLQKLNQAIQGPMLFDAKRFEGISLSAPTQKLLVAHPQPKDVVRLNRLLLQDSFPTLLATSSEKLFRDFKRVIGTLGGCNVLLLLVALANTSMPGGKRSSAATP